MFETIPYIHFMTKTVGGRVRGLYSPAEAEEGSPRGGCFVVPVQGNSKLFSTYRFNYSIYLGKGRYLEDEKDKNIFSGLAFRHKQSEKEILLCAFSVPFLYPFLPYPPINPSPINLLKEEGIFFPTFNRVPSTGRLSTYQYMGRLTHQDFRHKFVEIEPTDPKSLDLLLEKYQISIIGCDPFTNYKGVEKRSQRI